jgi:signal transduction histidine kinase
MIEDSLDDARLLRLELERAGYELVSERVETGSDVEEALRDRDWDIVFSDWTMPGFSAPDALEIVKQRGLDLPFIIISGSIGEDVVIDALRSGAHDFFVKGRLTLLPPAVERELREAALRRERRHMQEQLMIGDRMASVGLLAAGVAHEINNPLAVVIGNIELSLRLLEDKTADDPCSRDVSAQLRDAHEAAERIRNVANDLKLFARADSEEHTGVDVRPVIESSLRMAHNEIRHRARLRTSFAVVPPVEANESRLGQVFLNLIVNAAHSIPEGRADVNEISVATMLAPNGHVVVQVRDTGSGMSADVMKHLFSPFFTTKPLGLGTGLGLSICHRIVTSFGGTITVESDLGRGSVFEVHLLPAERVADPVAPAAALRASDRRGSVLVVDDEPAIGLLVTGVLGKDHDVTSTTTALEALEWITQGARYDVILCDLMMPHLTGMDFYSELTRIAPEQAQRVIFLTGGAFTPQARQFLDEVDNMRIDKPFKIQALSAIVNDRV